MLHGMRSPRAVMFAVLVVLALAGCGSNGPAPQAWAADVCDALGPWRDEIDTLTSGTEQQMTAKTTPAQAKENLVRLLGGAEKASEDARASVERAGVPDVDQGAPVATGFVGSLAAVRDAYGKAKRTIEGLDTGPTFYDGVGAAVETLNKEYDASALDTSKLNSPELVRAFDEVPECR
jgi:predicted small lipoprotein YifL